MSASTRFALGTFAASDSRPFAGLVVGDRVWELGPHLGAAVTLRALVERWDRSFPELQALAERIDGEDGAHAIDDLRPLPPVAPAGQIFCAGANFRQHVLD